MSEWQPVATPPEEGLEIWAFNPFVGAYRTKRIGDEYPMHGWDGLPGVWFPVATHWTPASDEPPPTP